MIFIKMADPVTFILEPSVGQSSFLCAGLQRTLQTLIDIGGWYFFNPALEIHRTSEDIRFTEQQVLNLGDFEVYAVLFTCILSACKHLYLFRLK